MTADTTTKSNNKSVIYLTGSSGFIGQMIVKLCQQDETIAKVYCPIRNKKGESGQDRFDNLFGDLSKAAFVDVSNGNDTILPEDVTHVILNAYSVKFDRPLVDILKDNVAPMLAILKECRTLGIQGCSIVSTAYVQPPLPYQRDVKNRIEFLLKDHTTAYQLYQDLLAGTTTQEETMNKIESTELRDFYSFNNYAFSKHIMEHVIHELFGSHPICIVRPSIVAPSRDGVHGHGVPSGFSLFMDISQYPVMRFPRNEGKLSLVYVEDAAHDILQGAVTWAQPASPHERSGTLFHPIRSSTSASTTGVMESFQHGALKIRRFDIRNDMLRQVCRTMELTTIRIVMGPKKANMMAKVYENFDPVMKNTWDFEPTRTMDGFEHMVQSYFSIKQEKENKTRTTNTDYWDAGNNLVLLLLAMSFFITFAMSSELQMVRAFVLLRMLVLKMEQALFYGDTFLRKWHPATLNTRPHDTSQHEREQTIWPSVLFSGLEMYIVFGLGLLPNPTTMKFCTWNSFYSVLLTHALPVEFLYYWGHRWMHMVPDLYKIHKHHHLSIVPTPKTSVTFLWSEHFFYDLLFALPVLVPAYFGEATIASTLLYVPIMDFLNTLGHTNMEVFPKWYMNSPMYYFFYCTTYHHVHHKYFKYNYALFMPIYDMIFGTYSKKLTENDFYAAKKGVVHTA